MSPTPEHLEAYVAALKAHYWEYLISLDPIASRRGADERVALRETQRLVDPLFRVWNEYAPERHRVHVMSTPDAAARRVPRGIQVSIADVTTPRDLFYAAAIGALMTENFARLRHDLVLHQNRYYAADEIVVAAPETHWPDDAIAELANDMADAAMKARRL